MKYIDGNIIKLVLILELQLIYVKIIMSFHSKDIGSILVTISLFISLVLAKVLQTNVLKSLAFSSKLTSKAEAKVLYLLLTLKVQQTQLRP